jgi:hypothetical protein
MNVERHTIAETPQFLRDAAAAGVSDEERKTIVDGIAADPRQGIEIRGSGGVRKIRVAGRGKSKSGGCRVIAAYFERLDKMGQRPAEPVELPDHQPVTGRERGQRRVAPEIP